MAFNNNKFSFPRGSGRIGKLIHRGRLKGLATLGAGFETSSRRGWRVEELGRD
jgi:hypothetical protein